MNWIRDRLFPLLAAILVLAACDEKPSAAKGVAVSSEPEKTLGPTENQLEAPPAEAPEEVITKDALGHQTELVTIYYRHPRFEAIVPLRKSILRHINMADQIKQVIDYLTIPPKNEKGLPIWPVNTYVREVYPLRDGTVVVDLDGRFLGELSIGCSQEEFMVYSLVNSILVNFAPYDKVRVLVDGEPRETLLGHIDIEFPLQLQETLYKVLPEENEDDDIVEEDLDTASEKAPTERASKDKPRF